MLDEGGAADSGVIGTKCHVCRALDDRVEKKPPGDGISSFVREFNERCWFGETTTELCRWMLVKSGGGLCCISRIGELVRDGTSMTCSDGLSKS